MHCAMNFPGLPKIHQWLPFRSIQCPHEVGSSANSPVGLSVNCSGVGLELVIGGIGVVSGSRVLCYAANRDSISLSMASNSSRTFGNQQRTMRRIRPTCSPLECRPKIGTPLAHAAPHSAHASQP